MLDAAEALEASTKAMLTVPPNGKEVASLIAKAALDGQMSITYDKLEPMLRMSLKYAGYQVTCHAIHWCNPRQNETPLEWIPPASEAIGVVWYIAQEQAKKVAEEELEELAQSIHEASILGLTSVSWPRMFTDTLPIGGHVNAYVNTELVRFGYNFDDSHVSWDAKPEHTYASYTGISLPEGEARKLLWGALQYPYHMTPIDKLEELVTRVTQVGIDEVIREYELAKADAILRISMFIQSCLP